MRFTLKRIFSVPLTDSVQNLTGHCVNMPGLGIVGRWGPFSRIDYLIDYLHWYGI